MGPATRLRQPTVLVLLLLVCAGIGVGLYFIFRKTLPEPGSRRYLEYVEAFQVGVAALDAGNLKLADEQLTRAIEIIPEEPAAWADRGLKHLRAGDELKEAAADLRRAHELAPKSSEIESLLGQLEKLNGRYPEAADHFRKALQTDPNDLQTRFALAEVLEMQGGPEGDAGYQEQMEEVLRVQPNNLFVLTRLAGVAARRGDAAALGRVLDRLGPLSPAWDPETRRLLQELQLAAAEQLPGQVPAVLVRFINKLSGEPGYPRDKRAVEGRSVEGATLIGTSVQRFLALKPPPATPAPPDTGLTFTTESLPAVAGGARGDTIRAVWLTDVAGAGEAGAPPQAWDSTKEEWVAAPPGPVVLVANGRKVLRSGDDAFALDFPGGPGATPPTVAGIIPIDWDNDFRTDLILAGAGGLRFYRQGGDGRFVDVTDKTNLPKEVLQGDYFGGWAADIDMDGDLDVILAPRQGEPVVLRNNRDGTFKALHLFPGVDGARAFAWADLDNDGAPDAAFLDARGQVHLFANERLAQFRRRETPAGLGTGLALAVADVNDDGLFDLLVLQADGRVVRISDKDKGKALEVAPVAEGPAFAAATQPGTAVLLAADLDNNGGLDLVASTPAETRAWLSDTDSKFHPGPTAPPRVTAAVDLTHSGRLDLLALSDDGQPVRLTNRGTKDYHWQDVRPQSSRKENRTADERINSYAIGSEIEARSGLVVQKQLVTVPVVHFGLGERRHADVFRIVWTNGVFQAEFFRAEKGQHGDAPVVAVQRLGSSCPFLFAWDGTRMGFVTDFMWGAPLGVLIDGQDTTTSLQTTSWVKVRGEQMAPRDGYYDVRVLANLWETHFYDHLALMVVDHPPGTEIYVDERAADRPLVPEVVVTGPPRSIARARDQDGRVVTDILRADDGRYLDGFQEGRFPGVAQDHWVEVELPDDGPADGPVWLLARGWVYPPDSNVYVAISQGKHDQPRGVDLEVPDGRGGWKAVREALGCPAGKNKTILIRLDGADGPGVPRRFRLRTNQEIFWDSLAYARGLDASLAATKRLAPDAADLRRHGTVEMTQANPSSPELPDYERVIPVEQDWRDLTGYHTRYGDVRELLAAVDDRYVIMTSGDEIALRFRAPAGPPAGWKRDFVWVADGWTKAGEMNTRFSKTVLPLPAHDLRSYVTPPGRLEDDPVYHHFPQDWEKYHTRYVTPDAFERGLRNFRRPRP
jgi:hypothetical protein